MASRKRAGNFIHDDLLQEFHPAEEPAFGRGEAQQNKVGGHRHAHLCRQLSGIHPEVIAGSGGIDKNLGLGRQKAPVHPQVFLRQEEPHVRSPGRDQGTPKGPHLDHGDDRAAPLGHAVGFGGDHLQTQGRGGFG